MTMSIKTLSRLRDLRLSGMAKHLEQQLEQPGTYSDLSFTERLDLMLDHELLSRDHRKQERLISQAKLKLRATVQEIDYKHPRGIQKAQLTQLIQCEWINRHQNLLITGPCGSGKTYLACALGHNACMNGFNVRYHRLSRLVLALTQSKADGSYQRLLGQLSKIDLLIIDDWGLEPLSAAHRNDLMEIMDDRYGNKSTLMISQLPTDQWYASIGDNTLADAILDRLMHNAHRLNLQGESMRKRKSELTEREHCM
jgi:DNA replication protein DnaC